MDPGQVLAGAPENYSKESLQIESMKLRRAASVLPCDLASQRFIQARVSIWPERKAKLHAALTGTTWHHGTRQDICNLYTIYLHNYYTIYINLSFQHRPPSAGLKLVTHSSLGEVCAEQNDGGRLAGLPGPPLRGRKVSNGMDSCFDNDRLKSRSWE